MRKVIIPIVIFLITTSSVSAAVRLVPDDYPTIGAAISACADGDEVVVADGIYIDDGNRDLFINRNVTIRSENGPDGCIIDCNGSGAEPHRAFVIGSNVTIAGFSIINGHAEEGGAICYEYGSSPTIINCVLKDNSAIRQGGAIYCESSDLMIINCTIKDNSVENNGLEAGGGGIYTEMSKVNIISSRIIQNSANNGAGISCQQNSNMIIKACTISNNTAEAEGGFGRDDSFGGGIYCWNNSILTVVDSAICNNIARGGNSSGGGIFFNSSYEGTKLTILNCNINGNSVEDGWASRGGGIFCDLEQQNNPALVISECTIDDNAANVEKDKDRSYGGGIYCYRGRPIVDKCKINNNSATEGGGIACEQSSPIIAGSIINANFSLDRYKFGGGGIYCTDSSPSISNCTIVGNFFYGIYCEDGHATITNSILYYNGDGRWDLDQIHGSNAVVTYSDVQMYKPSVPPWPGIGNINTDPCFAESGYWDVNSVWIEGDYHLLADSFCIDAGNLTSYLLGNTDLDENPRIIGQIDMGAYEFATPTIFADMEIMPNTINLNSMGKWIYCHIRIPKDYDVADIDTDSIWLEDVVKANQVLVKSNFVKARFNRSDVQTILKEGYQELVVTGNLIDGTRFEGTGAISVIDKSNKRSIHSRRGRSRQYRNR